MQNLIIIFGISLIGIATMIYRGISRVQNLGSEHGEMTNPVTKNITNLWGKIKLVFNYFAHSIAILVSKLWARISHKVLKIRKSMVIKIENYFKHTNEKNINKEAKTQSILLTTIKAYKREIKKLNQKIEHDQIGSKSGTKSE